MVRNLIGFFALVSIFTVTGCGNINNGTSGAITLDDPKINDAKMLISAKATYTPEGKTLLSGQKVNFYWSTLGLSSGTRINYTPDPSSLDIDGTATGQFNMPFPRTEGLYVEVYATIGGLTSIKTGIEVKL